MNIQNPKIICLVGASGAGKSTIANILTDIGKVKYVSLSTKVREYVDTLGIREPTRAQLQLYANELRSLEGNSVFAKMALKDLEVYDEEIILVDGVRHPDEIEVLRASNFTTYVLGVDSDQRKRFERILMRKRPSDPKTWEEFLECDIRENGGEQKQFQQENARCLEMADFIIQNNGDLAELGLEIQRIFESIYEGEIDCEIKLNFI